MKPSVVQVGSDPLANKPPSLPKKKPQLLGLFHLVAKPRSALLAAAALAFTVFTFFHRISFKSGKPILNESFIAQAIRL